MRMHHYMLYIQGYQIFVSIQYRPNQAEALDL